MKRNELFYIRLVQTQSRKSKSWVSLVIISCRYFAKKSIQILRAVSYFYLNDVKKNLCTWQHAIARHCSSSPCAQFESIFWQSIDN